MNIRPLARRALMSFPIVLLAVLALSGSVAAATPNTIEGVWSFNGGAVGIQALSNGTFQGTVVTPTKFASCEHPVGQVMWTDMRQRADGSFLGLHQWYHGASCEENPVLGHTAWRVLESSGGARVLKVCFNLPGDEELPTIAPSGAPFSASEYAAYHVTYECVESTPLAPPQTVEGGGTGKGGPGTITFSQVVVLPKATAACVSQTSLKITLRDPKYDPLEQVVVRINGKKVADVNGIKHLKKGILLKELPSGIYKVSAVATTVLKQRLSGSRTYRSCAKGSVKIKLHRVKKHHG